MDTVSVTYVRMMTGFIRLVGLIIKVGRGLVVFFVDNTFVKVQSRTRVLFAQREVG